MTLNILYIHGANATDLTFEYIRLNLPKHNDVYGSYSIDTPIDQIVKNIEKFAKNEFKDSPFNIIAHSMGGLIALKIANCKNLNVEKIFTMATPFNGHKFAEFLKWVFPSYQLYMDISPSSKFIRGIQRMKFNIPIKSVVTLNGYNPVFREPNDGVVTIESQSTFKYTEFYEINLCHFEVLLSKQVINHIEDFIFTDNQVNVEKRI